MSKNISGPILFEESKQLNKSNQQNRNRQHANPSKSSTSTASTSGNKYNKKQFSNNLRQSRCPKSSAKNTQMSKQHPISYENRLNSRKIGTNDLIGFNFRGTSTYDSLSSKPKHKAKWYAPVNKQQFIQAKSQLILKDGKDYSIHLADSDVLFNWDDVERLNVWSIETPNCPICLQEASAAKITRCGHVYCWSCVLRYLDQDECSSRKCPVCNDLITVAELKSVKVFKDENHNVGSTITMSLMKRPMNSTTVIPVERNEAGEDISSLDLPKYQADKLQRNFKFLVASTEVILEDIIDKELQELKFELGIESDEAEKVYIEMAINECGKRRDLLLNTLNQKTVNTNNNSIINDPPKHVVDSNENSLNVNKPPTKYFYFYQVEDGQHIYLNQVNMRCLSHQYGPYESLPLQISGRILQIDQHTMDQETRRHHKFMSHIPLTLKFLVVELDLLPPTVSEDTLKFFEKILSTRKQHRIKREREERQQARKAKKEALRRSGKHLPANYQLGNEQQFPGIQSPNCASYSVLITSPSTSSSSSSIEHQSSALENLSLDPPCQTDDSPQTPSFAQIMRPPQGGATQKMVWPKVASNQKVQTSSPSCRFAEEEDDDDEIDPAYTAPSFKSSFNLSFNFPQSSTTSTNQLDNDSKKMKKKNKKAAKKVLFSTGCRPR